MNEGLAGGWILAAFGWVPYEERGYSAHFSGEEDPWVGEHRHFVECVRDNKPVVSDGHFGRRVQEILNAGYESAKQRRAISLAPKSKEQAA